MLEDYAVMMKNIMPRLNKMMSEYNENHHYPWSEHLEHYTPSAQRQLEAGFVNMLARNKSIKSTM